MELTYGMGIEAMRRKKAAPNYGEFMTADAQQYYNENMGAIAAQRKIIPSAMQAEEAMLPQLQGYQQRSMESQSQNLLGQYGQLQPYANQAQQQYQNQLIGMYGQGGQMATNYAVQSLGPQGAQNYNMFQQQAGEGLAMGSGLGYQDQMYAEQSARAAMSARGLTGNQAVGQEVLNSYQLGNQRLQQRQAMGAQAYQMAGQQQSFGQQTYNAPAMQTSQGLYGVGELYGATQNSFQSFGPQFLQPESQYLANIRGNRISQENADKAAKAQRDSGFMSMLGAVAGAAIGCWVAREVYGTKNDDWLIFRKWLLTEAPIWFKDLYLENGERFANFISDKPYLKKLVKFAMDRVVEPRRKYLQLYA
jgi:hypothetical protein